jgi:hypothetical protein
VDGAIRGIPSLRSKLTLAFACACALVVALSGAASLRAETTPEEPAVETVAETPLLKQSARQRMIDRWRHETWHWQRTMGQRKLLRELRKPPAQLAAKLALWKRVAKRTRYKAQNPPHKLQWLCIHRYEGSWTDPNGPYYGGLQMDLSFQRVYGAHLLQRKGTADHWTPLEQMWVAERAHRAGRGFYPWPNTARSCGLI